MRCWSSTIFFSAMVNTSEKYISKHLPQGGVGSLVPVFLTPFGKKKKEKFKVVLNPLQSNLDYPDLDYPDYSIIRTFFYGPNFFMNIN